MSMRDRTYSYVQSIVFPFVLMPLFQVLKEHDNSFLKDTKESHYYRVVILDVPHVLKSPRQSASQITN